MSFRFFYLYFFLKNKIIYIKDHIMKILCIHVQLMQIEWCNKLHDFLIYFKLNLISNKKQQKMIKKYQCRFILKKYQKLENSFKQ